MSDTVLVPFDGSPLANRALRHTFDRFPDADVIVYYVIDVFDASGFADPDSTYRLRLGIIQDFFSELHDRPDEAGESRHNISNRPASFLQNPSDSRATPRLN